MKNKDKNFFLKCSFILFYLILLLTLLQMSPISPLYQAPSFTTLLSVSMDFACVCVCVCVLWLVSFNPPHRSPLRSIYEMII